MFIEIDNTGMSIVEITKGIMDGRKLNGERISPEFAMEILSKTNHLGHIKMILKNINKQSDEDKKKYKEFVLSCVDRREQSPNVMEALRNLAEMCGVRDEFETINNKAKVYGCTYCNGMMEVKSKKELLKLNGDDLVVFFNANNVDLSDVDLSHIKFLKFKEEADVRLSKIKKNA